jgi:iron-sulfur cluster insertion protein
MEHTFLITDTAAKRIVDLVSKKNNPELKFRITILGGGCSGFQYNFSLDETQNLEDILFTHNGAQVIVDETSLGLLENAVLDFEESLMGATFSLKNPNASSSCGCGNSFSV